MNKPLYTSNEWDFETLHKTWEVIDKVGREIFKLTYDAPQFEVVTYEQMLDRYTSHGMPTFYNHWSFGKAFIAQHDAYARGDASLAYEIVVNTNPPIASIMENNTMTMQALVMAHSVCGHASFFKNNYMFKEWTNPDSFLGYLTYAKNYIAECELKYGEDAVEQLLDAAHSLQYHGFDRMKRGRKMKHEELKARQDKWADYLHETITRTTDIKDLRNRTKKIETIIEELGKDRRDFPEENLLYFIEKYSPILKTWQREIIRIVRKIAQYFYPNFHTKMMNEGWASFIHYHIMTHLETEGYIGPGHYLEFLRSHTAVCCDHKQVGQFNPYSLGFAMFRDIERICKDPTAEDKEFFPEFAGNPDWLGVCTEAMSLYRDESFIQKFLSPKVVRDFKMFAIYDDSEADEYLVEAVHSTDDLQLIRDKLSEQYQLDRFIPHIEITGVDWEDTRALKLKYYSKNGITLDLEKSALTEQYLARLWGYPLTWEIESDDPDVQSLLNALFKAIIP